MKNKIGWCNTTWNPVWGCLNHCEYCYARKMAKRFAGKIAEKEIDEIYGGSIDGNSLNAFYEEKKEDIENFIPTFLHSQFEKRLPKKPQRIFVGSMSEIAHWEHNWVMKVLRKIEEYPQHIFQFLTKYPRAYKDYKFPPNCWLGITVTNNSANYAPKYLKRINFISIEPILEEINVDRIDFYEPNWIIVGAETGTRKGKIIPKKEWIESIVDYCKDNNIPVYLKDSLKNIYPEEIKEFPNYK